MTTEQLKPCPCPYCGRELVLRDDFHGKFWGHFYEHSECIAYEIRLADSIDVGQWNTRPIEDALRAKLKIAVEALEEVCKYGCGILCEEADGEHHSFCPQRIALEALTKIRGCE